LANGQSTPGSSATSPRPQNHASEAVSPAASELQGRAARLFHEAKALFTDNQFSKAVPVLREAAKVAPNDPVIHQYLDYALWKEDRYKEAGEEFAEARRLDPKNAYTLYFLGRVFEAQSQTDASIHSYESEFGLGTPVYDTYQRLTEAYLRRGESKKALDLVQRALQMTPWESSLHYQLARIYQKTGRLNEAKEEFDATNRLKQSDQTSIQKLLDIFMAIQESKPDRVSSLRQELLAQTSRDPEIMHSLGLLLGKNGYYAEAREPLGLAAQMMPESYDAHYNLGLTLMKVGNAAEAEPALRKAVELRPDAFGANSALAVLYVNQGRSVEAIEHLNAARQARPDDAGILALLGDQYLQTADWRAAIPLLRDAIRLKPENPNPWHVLIQAYQQEKDFAKALDLSQKGAERFPLDGRFQFEIGNQLSNLVLLR
jgi:tetratricopeptide (TPR) repeat protein